LQIIGLLIIGAFALFVIVAGATKMAVKEALHEFKEEIMEEFNLKRFIVDNENNEGNINEGINEESNKEEDNNDLM
jgi:hypothetical protein